MVYSCLNVIFLNHSNRGTLPLCKCLWENDILVCQCTGALLMEENQAHFLILCFPYQSYLTKQGTIIYAIQKYGPHPIFNPFVFLFFRFPSIPMSTGVCLATRLIRKQKHNKEIQSCILNVTKNVIWPLVSIIQNVEDFLVDISLQKVSC